MFLSFVNRLAAISKARRRRQLLRRALAALIEEEASPVDAGRLTEGLMLMLDGIWLEISLNPGSINESRTRRLCWFWLAGSGAAAHEVSAADDLDRRARRPWRGGMGAQPLLWSAR